MARRPARSRTKTSHDKSVRYAVIGLGHIAQAAVLPAFKHARRNSVLAALVSGEEKKLRQLGRRYGVQRICGYDGVDELFASGEIDAVYIALPNDMHREYTVRAARAGLHVLCEKPMAVTVEECEEMIARDARRERQADDRVPPALRARQPRSGASSRAPASWASSVSSTRSSRCR